MDARSGNVQRRDESVVLELVKRNVVAESRCVVEDLDGKTSDGTPASRPAQLFADADAFRNRYEFRRVRLQRWRAPKIA